MNTVLRNNTGNQTKEGLIEGFVVRKELLGRLVQDLVDMSAAKGYKGMLVIGQRGAGKTTLLYRLKYEVEDQLKEASLLPLMLTEEQYYLTQLVDLWEKVAEMMEDQFGFVDLLDRLDRIRREKPGNEFSIIQSALAERGAKLVLFLENADDFFKKIGVEEQRKLRDLLEATDRLFLVFSSTIHFDAISEKGMFYQVFRKVELSGLTNEETTQLLIKMGKEAGQQKQIEEIIEKNPGRIESMRRLTGGIPRTISYLFNIFLDNENGKAVKDLYQLIDNLTFLYKAEMDALSPLQQKVMDAIAKNWDAISTKEIAEKIRMESKQVSSILQVLEKDQVIEAVDTNTKNKLYRLRDRFMNIWYLIRFGRASEKENVIWLVRFYDTWCDRAELLKHISRHLQNLQSGKYDSTAALNMGNTFLACDNVPDDVKYNIYQQTRNILPRKVIKDLRLSDRDLYGTVNKFLKDGKNENALEALNNLQEKTEKRYSFTAWTYSRIGNYQKAEEAARQAFELNPQKGRTAYQIGYYNHRYLFNKPVALEYYQKALDLGEYMAAMPIGDLQLEEDNLKEAARFYDLAIAKGIYEAYLAKGKIYMIQNNLVKAERMVRTAIENKVTKGYFHLGLLYSMRRQHKKAQEMLKRAYQAGVNEALVYSARMALLRKRPDFAFAIRTLRLAVKKEVADAAYYLAKALSENGNFEEAETILTKEAANGDARAAHSLAHLYSDRQQFEQSDEYFIKAIKLGHESSLICLTTGMLENGRNDKRQFALDFLRSNPKELNGLGVIGSLQMAKMLLWNDELTASQEEINGKQEELLRILKSGTDDEKEAVMLFLTSYMLLLIAKKEYETAFEMFSDKHSLQLKQKMKPIYFALMNYMEKKYPKEYLKAGAELQDTLEEVKIEIERISNNLK